MKGLNEALETSIRRNWNLPALSDFKGETMSYGHVARRIVEMHLVFAAIGLKPGEKVALCAKNSAAWATAFLGALTYGAVVVPLLHEFHPDTVEALVAHSEARLLFSEKGIYDKLDAENMPGVDGVVLIPDFTVALSRKHKLTAAIDGLKDTFLKAYGKKSPRRRWNLPGVSLVSWLWLTILPALRVIPKE